MFDSEPEALRSGSVESAPDRRSASSRPILVCEDDPLVAGFFAEVLAAAGHTSVVARNGEVALRMAAELRPAAITLDLDLPRLHGGAVLSRLRGDPATWAIPVIVVSAYPGWLTFLERHRAAAVLEKPTPPWELATAVEQALAAAADAAEGARGGDTAQA
jgi:CheY-like chemotaxis protein